MYAYLFIEVEPGLARTVMESLVGAKAVDRAAIVTGDFDVFARIDDISWDDLGERVLGSVQRVPGVVRTETAIGTELTQAYSIPKVPPLPVPLRGRPLRGDKHVALVFVSLDPESGEEAVEALARADGTIAFAFVTGSYDAVVQVSGKDFGHIMRRVMKMRRIAGVRDTSTKLVVASTPFVAEKRSPRT